MGVYIKDMEMPQNCQSCNFYNGLGCKATGRMFPMFYNVAVRRSDCPLIEATEPHGRLIDADALVDKHFSKDYLAKAMTASKDDLGTALVNVPLVINNAPTIIPSREEEKT